MAPQSTLRGVRKIAWGFMRSALWTPETWEPDALPPHARIVKSVQQTEEALEELEKYYGAEYAARLYRKPPARLRGYRGLRGHKGRKRSAMRRAGSVHCSARRSAARPKAFRRSIASSFRA
ncbi:hypothetical protein AB0M95_11520 [Sphaerisporangium sp. NPDC051017]|uniref:hypothetical protein n=1 Tax=Sphaerisporangium sp. NPDC051017 TaxID=3154636 RepID=UPI00342F9C3D